MSHQQWENVFLNTHLDPLEKLESTYNFAACTAQSLFGTIFDHGSWQLSPSCNSCAATVAVEIWPQMGQIITSTAWKTIWASCCYNFSRVGHLCDQQDYYGGSQDKQKHHCMVAPVELETSATGHETSNQGETPDLPQHKPRSPCKKWWLPTTSQLHFFAPHNLYLRPFYTMAAGSCPKVAILAQTLLAPNGTASKNKFWTLPRNL